MSKHAPWTVEERDHETNLVRIAGDDGITIANAKGHSARLIAAAPELLEALYGLGEMGLLDPRSNDSEESAARRLAARAAIAKAEGK